MKIEIRYCAECGFAPRAIRLTERLLENFEHSGLDEISIQVGDEGVFDVSIDGEPVFVKSARAPFPADEDVIAEVRTRLRR